jgi:hypothetical protein
MPVDHAADALVVTFRCPSTLLRERDRRSDLPMVGNGPPGTFVVFPHGFRVSLPTDLIVSAEVTTGCARVAFGGMRFRGLEGDQLVFTRERELWPEDQLSPARSRVMRLDRAWLSSVTRGGQPVWP